MVIGNARQDGTTLVELSVALAILALTLSIVWPRWSRTTTDGSASAARRVAIEMRRRNLLSDAE